MGARDATVRGEAGRKRRRGTDVVQRRNARGDRGSGQDTEGGSWNKKQVDTKRLECMVDTLFNGGLCSLLRELGELSAFCITRSVKNSISADRPINSRQTLREKSLSIESRQFFKEC